MNQEHTKGEGIFTSGIAITTLLVFLLPLFFTPESILPTAFSKGLLMVIATLILLIYWLVRKLKEGEFKLPYHPVFLAALAVPVVYIFSALLSEAPKLSLFGVGLEPGSAFMVLMFFILLLLIPLIVSNEIQLLLPYAALSLTAVVIALFQLVRLVFGPDVLSFGLFVLPVSNLVGSWNDLGTFFALMVILLMTSLELLNFQNILAIPGYILLAISLFFLAVINFGTVWFVLAIFSIVLFVYVLTFGRMGSLVLEGDGVDTSRRRQQKGFTIAVTPLIVFTLSLIFILSGGVLGEMLSDTFGTGYLEARPSWQSTLDITRHTMASDPILGVGPNLFSDQWVQHRPEGIQLTPFWNVDFQYGIGFLPTAATTVGALGIVAWLAFLGLYLYLGVRGMIFSLTGDTLSRFLITSSFFSSLFLWIIAFFHIPNVVMLSITFLLTGVFLAALYSAGRIPSKRISFENNPTVGFVSIFVMVLLLIGSITSAYLTSQKAIAAVMYQRGLVALSENDLERGQSTIERAANLNGLDAYYQVLAQIEMAKLNGLLTNEALSEDALREQFQGILAQALDAANRAIEAQPKDYANWLTRGSIYESLVPLEIEGAYDSALNDYTRAQELNPTSPALYLNRARLELTTGNTDGARELIGEALAIKADYTEAVYLLAQIEAQAGNAEEAIQSIEQVAILSPNDPIIFFQLGLLRFNIENYEGAVGAFERAIALEPSYSNARYFLGLAYNEVGRTTDAIEQFETIQELNPDNEEVRQILDNLRVGTSPFTDITPPVEDPTEREELPLEE